MSQEQLQDPIYLKLVESRVTLLFHFAFFGTLASRMKLIDASSWVNTAATDGRSFYYNRQFIADLDDDELLFLMGHEVLHAVYDHLGRRCGRDPGTWNVANDYIVNYTLVKQGVGKMPRKGLISDRYTDEMTSEEVYNLLQMNSTTIEIDRLLDEHLELGDDSKDNPNGKGGSVSITVMGENGPPQLTEEDLAKIRNEVLSAVINSAQQFGAGSVPAGVLRMIEDLTEPKMDWRTMLETEIKSTIRDDFTYRKFSKNTWSSGVILPSQDVMDTIEIAAAIDASGSMTEQMLKDFLGELKGIMEQFPDFVIKVWSFDTKIYAYKEFKPDNLDEIYEYPLKGGGGTDFMVNWKFMREEEIEPHKLVIFTDGYPNGEWGEEDYCDTLFIIHSDKGIESPFGKTAYYTDHLND